MFKPKQENCLKYIFLFMLLPLMCSGQRFSLLAEAGIVRGQIDGDKLQGFHYPGYVFGIGTNYSFNRTNDISVKTSYYRQGSISTKAFSAPSVDAFQIQMDMNTIGLEISYKYDPEDQFYFLGGGIVRHQVVKVNYEIDTSPFTSSNEKFTLDSEALSTSYFGVKIYYGINLLERAGAYFALESGFTDLLKEPNDRIKRLSPYFLSAVFTYEIIAPNIEEKKNRPGSKARLID